MKKRILSITLAMTLCLGLFAVAPFTASAADLDEISSFYAGNFYSLALKEDGTLWGWAWDGNSAGRPNPGNYVPRKTTPAKLMDNVKSIHGSIALKNDNTLWCIPVSQLSPVVFETPMKIADDVTSVQPPFVIRSDGSFWELVSEQKTYSGRATIYSIKRVDNNVAALLSNDMSVAFGEGMGYGTHAGLSSFVVKADGTLWAWGKNSFGQVGTGTTEDVLSPVKILDNVVSVSAAGGHAAAITTDGELYAWGAVLGTTAGTPQNPLYSINSSPVKITDNVKSVVCSYQTNYFIKTDNSLWYWGGGGIAETFPETATSKKLFDNVSSVIVDSGGGFAIKTDNTLWAWGDNPYGEKGNGTFTEIAEPEKVADNVISVQIGAYSTVILKTDGSLWAAGNIIRGELNQNLRDKPVFVKFTDGVKLLTTTVTPPTTTPALVAKPTASTVLVNGKNVAFDAYNISGNNYFKLRDLAYILSGTEKQFEVSWDGANNAIVLTSGKPYTTVGGEMTGKGAGDKTPIPTNSKIIMDGKEVQFTAYNIEGNNYFKLRDIGAAFDFGVDWDGANNTIVIDTSKGYTPE